MSDQKFDLRINGGTIVIQDHVDRMDPADLLDCCERHDVTTMLIVGQHGSLGEVRTEIDLSYLADATMMFRFFEAEGAVRSAVTVVKSRTAPNERTIREFRLSHRSGLQIGAPIADFEGVMSGMPRYAGVTKMMVDGGE